MPASFNRSDAKLTRSSIASTLPRFERLIISAAVSAKVQSRTGAAMSHHAPIDVHAHYFPQDFLDLIAKHGPSHGFEYRDRKSTRLNSSHSQISYAVFCLKKKIATMMLADLL